MTDSPYPPDYIKKPFKSSEKIEQVNECLSRIRESKDSMFESMGDLQTLLPRPRPIGRAKNLPAAGKAKGKGKTSAPLSKKGRE